MPTPTFYRADGWVKSSLGPAVPGAQIYVCTQPANIDFLPPTPEADIFSDAHGLVPIQQPIITDGFGHYDFYAAPGLYTVIVVNAGKVQQMYPDQSLGNFGTGTNATGLIAGTNIQIIGNVISATGGGGGIELQTDGVDNPNQDVLNLHSDDGSVEFTPDVDGGVNLKAVVNTTSLTVLHGFAAASNPSNFSTQIGYAWVQLGSGIEVKPPTATESGYWRIGAGVTGGMTDHADFTTLGIDVQLTTRMRPVSSGGTDNNVWICLVPQAAVAVSNPALLFAATPLTPVVGFKFRQGTDSTWVLYSSADDSGTNVTSHVTAVVPDFVNFHKYEFRVTGGGTSVEFFIDGVSLGFITSNLPPNDLPVSATLWNESISRSFDDGIDVQYLWYTQTV